MGDLAVEIAVSAPRRASTSRRAALAALLLSLAAGSGLRCREITCEPASPAALPGFLFGFSQGRDDVVPLSTGIGANAIRLTLSWRTLEPTVVSQGTTLQQVFYPQAVSAYAAGVDWSSHDAQIQAALDAGLYPVPIVGHGFSSSLPRLDGVPAAPDVLGRIEYLARQYLVTRATVERYDGDGVEDAPGSPRVAMWQIENELNQALLTGVFGWREPTFLEAFTSAWADQNYVNSLLFMLHLAVKHADPGALTMTNLHSDVNDGITSSFGLPGWKDWLLVWRPLLDVIGLDAYPNYYRPDPPSGAAVGERVAELQALACGRPVVVVETGYPTGPSERGYDEARQVSFLRDAFESVVASGAAGFFWFGSHTAESHDVLITQEDLDNLQLLADAFDAGDVAALLGFVIANPDYVQGHFSEVVQSVEPYWGALRDDGSAKPVWEELIAIGQNLPAP